jgi:hypothetical protein
MADSPTFSISNSFEREQTYIPGDWDIVDAYTQNYSLGWSEVYSSRLNVDLNFGVNLKDNIRSLDVDNKEIKLSFDGSLESQIWTVGFNLEDTISYSNELNVPRRDEIQYGVDLDLFPFFLPPFKLKLQRLWDEQDSLEDKTTEKLEANTEFVIGNSFDFSLAWKETQIDDRLVNNANSDEQNWDINFNYSKSLLPTLKIDLKTEYSGNRTDTLDNAGVVLNTDRERDLEHNFKITVNAFPNVSSTLEIVSEEDFVLEEKNLNLEFSASSDQQLVNLGTLTETIKIKRESSKGNLVDSQENNTEFSLELAGTPQKYTDYSVKYQLDLEDSIDSIDPTNDTDSREDAFDISLTLVPNKMITIESSFHWLSARENGSKSGTERDIKIEGVFEGAMLDIPNLVFNPKLEVNAEENLEAGTRSDTIDLELRFLYTPEVPSTFSYDFETIYRWKEGDTVESELELASNFKYILTNFAWDLSMEEKSSTTFDLEGNEPNVWKHDLDFSIGSDLTQTIGFDASYTYSYSEDAQDSDDLTTNLDWVFLTSSLSFSFSQSRTFQGPKDVTRTYSAYFSMDF